MLPETLSSLITVLPMPVVIVGPNERVAEVNEAAIRLFGNDGRGMHYITAFRQPAILDAIEQTVRDGTLRQTRYLGTEGRRDTYWQVTVGAVPMQVGRGVVLSFEDMTGVEESSQIRRDFVANVSHELRTPLTALLGFVETLKGAARDDPEARNRFLGIMEKEAGRMARLVDDLLWLSRVEQEERMRPRDMVDLSAILDRVVAAITPVAEKAGVCLVVKRPVAHAKTQLEETEAGTRAGTQAETRAGALAGAIPATFPEIPGDGRQLQQVITNLIENAVKYGGNDKQVEIALSGPIDEPSLRSKGVRISVTDHGEGIAPHHIPRLTERFYRVDNHRSREMGGTGLGLAIVKHIVNRHRGRLRIDSELGKGSRFMVILPLE